MDNKIYIEKSPLDNILKKLDNQKKPSQEPLPKDNFLIHLMIGMKGSGKTSMMMNLLNSDEAYKKYFDNIILVSTTAHKDPKMEPLINELKRGYEEEDDFKKYYKTLNNDILEEILSNLDHFNQNYIEEHKKKPNNLIIFDDCIHLMPSSTQKGEVFNELFTSNRHFCACVWVASQKYNKLNSLVRSQADLISFFKTHNEREFKSFSDDWGIDRKLLKTIYDIATNEPNSFLHINLMNPKPIFFKKFSKILI